MNKPSTTPRFSHSYDAYSTAAPKHGFAELKSTATLSHQEAIGSSSDWFATCSAILDDHSKGSVDDESHIVGASRKSLLRTWYVPFHNRCRPHQRTTELYLRSMRIKHLVIWTLSLSIFVSTSFFLIVRLTISVSNFFFWVVRLSISVSNSFLPSLPAAVWDRAFKIAASTWDSHKG